MPNKYPYHGEKYILMDSAEIARWITAECEPMHEVLLGKQQHHQGLLNYIKYISICEAPEVLRVGDNEIEI